MTTIWEIAAHSVDHIFSLNLTICNYAPNFEKVGDILVSACPCVCVWGGGHRDIGLKLHVCIPRGKIAYAYFWFSLDYLPLLNYGPLTNKGMKFWKMPYLEKYYS